MALLIIIDTTRHDTVQINRKIIQQIAFSINHSKQKVDFFRNVVETVERPNIVSLEYVNEVKKVNQLYCDSVITVAFVRTHAISKEKHLFKRTFLSIARILLFNDESLFYFQSDLPPPQKTDLPCHAVRPHRASEIAKR